VVAITSGFLNFRQYDRQRHAELLAAGDEAGVLAEEVAPRRLQRGDDLNLLVLAGEGDDSTAHAPGGAVNG
jgi:hypothetical protein